MLLGGCGGESGVAIDGKVVNGDRPYAKGTDGDVSVTLTPQDGKGGTCSAMVNEDGTFKVKSQGGSSAVPAGKYKVTETIYPANPDASKGPPMPATKTLPEAWEVGSAPKTFTLDLSKLQ
jgi:hypothetical protein